VAYGREDFYHSELYCSFAAWCQELAPINECLQLLWDHVMPEGTETKSGTAAGGSRAGKGSKRKAPGAAKTRARAGK